MKQFVSVIAFTALLAVFQSSTAHAAVFGDGGASLQGVLNGITTDGSSSVDVTTDEVPDPYDSHWKIGGSGGSISTVVISLASDIVADAFGIYDAADPTQKIQLFTDASGVGQMALVSILDDGSVILNFTDTGIDFSGNLFGYYLKVGATYLYSDSALNPSQQDHMYAYQGVGDEIKIGSLSAGPWSSNEYILAWESGDTEAGNPNYSDFVVLVESVSPVPEPATLAMWGIGAMGVLVAGRFRRKSA